MRLRITELPILPGSLEAPITATERGCISRRIDARISSRVYVGAAPAARVAEQDPDVGRDRPAPEWRSPG